MAASLGRASSCRHGRKMGAGLLRPRVASATAARGRSVPSPTPAAEDAMNPSVDLFANLGVTLHATLAAAGTEPVAWDTSTGAALVLRHHDVEALAHDPR